MMENIIIRYETETKFAPHGLVEALFNRRHEPVCACYLNISKFLESKSPTNFIINVTNETDIPIIKMSCIIYFYNVKSVINNTPNLRTPQELKPALNSSAEINIISENFENSGESLVKGISHQHFFEVNHFNEPYAVNVLVWSQNMNLQHIGFFISPKDQKQRTFNSKDGFLHTTIEQMVDIKKDYYESKPDYDWIGYDNFMNKFKTLAPEDDDEIE